MEFTTIEQYTKAFVSSKIAESVFLDVTESGVKIKETSTTGSIVLAMLWAKVLQHNNNFPVSQYPYMQCKDNRGVKNLILKVDDITMTIAMRTGTLKFTGLFVLDWFKRNFVYMLERYDPEFGSFQSYEKHWKTCISPDTNKSLKSSSYLVTVTNEKQGRITEFSVDKVPRDEDALSPKEPSVISDVISDIQLSPTRSSPKNVELEVLPSPSTSGSIEDGKSSVYGQWKSLLEKWFCEGWKVYLSTPHIDKQRLMDVIDLVLKYRDTSDIQAFYVRRNCDSPKTIVHLKDEVLSKYSPKNQLYTEYKVFAKIIVPRKNFNARFIGATKDGEAEVLMTSASFHGDHFDCHSMETVDFKYMPEEEFTKKFVTPLVYCTLSE